jgi:hypothetical protein
MSRATDLTQAASFDDAGAIDDRLLVACGLSVGAGLIHVVAAVQHVEESVLQALFFEALAAAQLLWAIAVYRSPGRRLLTAGAAASVLVVALWLTSRTTGLPGAWTPEPVGVIDSVASADELVLALLVVSQAAAVAWRRLLSGAGVWLIMLSSLALLGAEHVH